MISVAARNIQTAVITGVNYSTLAFWAESISMNRVLKGLKDANFILNLVCKIHIEYYSLKRHDG